MMWRGAGVVLKVDGHESPVDPLSIAPKIQRMLLVGSSRQPLVFFTNAFPIGGVPVNPALNQGNREPGDEQRPYQQEQGLPRRER